MFWILFSADTIHLCLWPLQKYQARPLAPEESLIQPKFVILRAVTVSCIGIAMGYYAALDNLLFP